mgnify:CR=1 FL=1
MGTNRIAHTAGLGYNCGMAKIVIDGRMINESGIGRYLRNLISNLQVLDKKNKYHILLLKKDFEDEELFMDSRSSSSSSLSDLGVEDLSLRAEGLSKSKD